MLLLNSQVIFLAPSAILMFIERHFDFHFFLIATLVILEHLLKQFRCRLVFIIPMVLEYKLMLTSAIPVANMNGLICSTPGVTKMHRNI